MTDPIAPTTPPTTTSPATAHPYDPLRSDEITAVVAAVQATGRLGDGAWFSTITLEAPPGEDVGQRPRRARLVIVDGPGASVIEAVVDVADGRIGSWHRRDGVRPPLGLHESMVAIAALHGHAGFVEALARRGITDLAQVQIDPWPTGSFGDPAEAERRIVRCISYYREEPGDNGYARPIEGLLAVVDMARGKVLEIVDHGIVPVPTHAGSYLPHDHEPHRHDLRPLEITQPEGPSFTIDGNVLRWQRWSMHVSLDPLEGLVLRDVGYEDGGRVRPILRRAAISEMVVPYGDPDPAHGWKNAFDVGEWGLGRMANSLALGCDCLGEIRYLDAVYADEHGAPATIANAICIHEEDVGILWKHVDLYTNRTEVRRARRLVISSIATVGNYEYAFYWCVHLDGSIELEVKLTGIVSTKAIVPGADTVHAPELAPGLAAPVHQHLFCARLDVCVDGPVNEVHEVDVIPLEPGEANPWENGFAPARRRLDRELAARCNVDPGRSRTWHIVNPTASNRLGRPTAYRLTPGPSPTLLAGEGSNVSARAGFARHNLWVTPVAPDERRAAGDYPNQHPGGEGLPRWTQADRSLVDTPIVVWHTFGVTHVPRPEDWPVMPVDRCGFRLVPVGFFDANPALDVPPPDHCH
ncbi:MAG: primary-amine oxidase [Acidimicrobiales bacterium]|nr:primary-amine oxidase [Acidimicrobiales bacterium]